jgi:hypothetical protein
LAALLVSNWFIGSKTDFYWFTVPTTIYCNLQAHWRAAEKCRNVFANVLDL